MKDVTKKKFSVSVLVVAMLVLCLALVGCGGDNNSSSSSSGGSDSSSNSSSSNEIPEDMLNWVGAWQSKSEIVSGAGEQETEAYTITFNIDGTFEVAEDGSELYAGTWEPGEGINGEAKTSDGDDVRLELAANNTKLIFDGMESGLKKIICVR